MTPDQAAFPMIRALHDGRERCIPDILRSGEFPKGTMSQTIIAAGKHLKARGLVEMAQVKSAWVFKLSQEAMKKTEALK